MQDKNRITNDQEYLVTALNCIGDGVIITDLAGCITYMNTAAEVLTEWKAKESYDKHIDGILSLLNIITLQPISNPINEVLMNLEKIGLKKNTSTVTKNGLHRVLSASYSPMRDSYELVTGVIIVFRDITKIKSLEDEITNERNNLAVSFEAIPVGVVLIDEERIIRTTNRALNEMLHITQEDMIGKRFGDGLFCKNSIDGGCGLGRSCSLCEMWGSIRRVMQSGKPCKDIILQHSFIVEGKIISPWFKINFVPIIINGKRHIILAMDDITEMIEREEELIRSKNFTLKIFDRFPIMMWRSDPQMRCDFTNQTWQEYTGFTMEQARGFGYFDVFGGENIIHVKQVIRTAYENRIPFVIEHQLKHHDGTYRWVVNQGNPYYDLEENYAGYIGSVYDMNDRMLAEKALKDNEEKYRQLFDNAMDAIILHQYDEVNNSSEIIEVNEAACRGLGYTKEELTKLTLYDIRSDEMKGKLDETYHNLLTREHYVYESVHLAKDGTRIPVEVSGHLFDMNGTKVILSICRDITERLNAEHLIVKAKEEAEAANIAKSEFLANMSHEIRTPINGMTGMIDLTLMTNLSEEQTNNLITAKNCADSLLNIINDVLDFSKMEAGKFRINNAYFDLFNLVEEINKIHAVRAMEKQIDLVSDLDRDLPNYLYGDPNRLRQVLNNLIYNAIKFTERGSVTFGIKKRSESGDDVQLEFTIKDTGIGISEEDKDKLFKSFSQIDASYTRKHGGTGLGLVISKQLIEMMGGQIWVESEVGMGSAFSFCLPFVIGKGLEKKPSVVVNKKQEVKLHILLAEDDPINRTVLTRMLENKGHMVEVASNGIEALEAYQGKHFDVILMDIQMPEMDGIEAVKQIRELEINSSHKYHTYHVPIIAVTAFALLGDRERFLNCGMDEYISKPIKIEELQQLILSVLAKNNYDDFNEVPIINGNGEVEFIYNSNTKSNDDLITTITKLDKLLNELVLLAMNQNYLEVEDIVHSIKELFCKIGAQELKDAAFKIELCARKGKYQTLWEDINHMKFQFEVIKKDL